VSLLLVVVFWELAPRFEPVFDFAGFVLEMELLHAKSELYQGLHRNHLFFTFGFDSLMFYLLPLFFFGSGALYLLGLHSTRATPQPFVLLLFFK
jgi:hypothetical protein